jgi:hypothetical protein
MTTRAPKGKASQTKTASLVAALAKDVRNAADFLDALATEYRTGISHNNDQPASFDTTAALVDAALDQLQGYGRAWPREHLKPIVVREAYRGKVIKSIKRGPPSLIIVLCSRRDHAMDDVHRLGRNPRDRRIRYVTRLSDVYDCQGMARTTPVVIHSWPPQNTQEIRTRLLAMFTETPWVRVFAAGISLLDWSTTIV